MIALIKRQAETVSAIGVVLAALYGLALFIAGPHVTEFVDTRIAITQAPIIARQEAVARQVAIDQGITRDTNRDVERLKFDLIRIETKLDRLIERLIPLREGRSVSPPQ